MTPAVHLETITKRFPGVVANDAVDLVVEEGTVHALLGENGAGKTTLMNVLYGLYQPTEGKIHINGIERSFDSPSDAIDIGIGMIHQHFMLVDPMTIAENVVLGNEPTKYGGLLVDHEQAIEEVRKLSERYGFDVEPAATIEDVSVGVQQRVEILKALYRGADILILDEPTAVLTPQEVDELFEVLTELTAQGKTIIFITHKLGEAMEAADEITILRDGQNVGTMDANTVTREELAQRMVGREVLMEPQLSANDPGEVVLSVDEIAAEDDRGVVAVSDVSFSIREGEILGIAGVDGNGQAELVEAITGLRSTVAGSMTYRGEPLEPLSRRDRIGAGIAYVPEDRQDRGMVMPFDLVENGILGSQRATEFAKTGRINWDRAAEHAEDIIAEYDVRPPNAASTAASLSGGNQQKFIVGREFDRDPKFVVATHPTRGVDIGAMEFIHEQLQALRSAGVAVLLISSNLSEVQSLSDRLAIMHDGSFSGVVDPASVTEEEIGLLMAGESIGAGVDAALAGTDGTSDTTDGTTDESGVEA